MRRTLLSVSMITAVGTALLNGGTFSIFTESQSSTGGFTSGTVQLSLNGSAAKTATFTLGDPCLHLYTDGTDGHLNLGTVNNTSCATTVTVHNAGTLPFYLADSSITDTVVPGASPACFTSSFRDGTGTAQVLAPGANQVVSIVTTTTSSAQVCQEQTDRVVATLVATERLDGPVAVGEFTRLTTPGDPIQSENQDATSPGPEGASNAIDGRSATKYLDFVKAGSFLTFTPSRGLSIASQIQFTSANDATLYSGRDPLTFSLFGSNDGVSFVHIFSGDTGLQDVHANYTDGLVVTFANSTAYTSYRLVLDTIRDSGANSVQFAEVDLHGYSAR